MEVVGIIGIIVAMAVFIILVYKGCLQYWAVMVSVAIVVLTNGMGFIDTLTENFIKGGINDLIVTMFSIVFMGAILGKLYTDTGAAASLATGLINRFVTGKDKGKLVSKAVITMFVFYGICTMGGIDGYVGAFTMYPIYLMVAKKCDIPKRFVPGMMFLNCAFMAAPGAPQVHNLFAVKAMNAASAAAVEGGGSAFFVSNSAGLIPGWISVIVISVVILIYYPRAIRKAQANGEYFENDGKGLNILMRDLNNLPNIIFSIIPLIAIFVSYSILDMDIFWALLIGIVLTVVLMGNKLPDVDVRGNRLNFIKSLTNSLNEGSQQYPSALISIVTPAGLAAVITATTAFGSIVGICFGLSEVFPLYVVTLIVVCIIVALTSSPPAALFIAIPNIIVPIALSAGVNMVEAAPAVTRICAIAASTFESLPMNGMCVLLFGIAGTTVKESYKPMFVTSVGATLMGAIVCTILCLIFPGIAMFG